MSDSQVVHLDCRVEETKNTMYLDFYNLNDKPFRITCDPKYFWLCEKHKEALAMLRYGILDNRGFLLLTGEVGTGKTLLVNQLMTLLPADAVVATLSDPDLTPIDFYRMLGAGFNLASPIESKSAFLLQLHEYLHESANQKKSVTLIVDEAQRLNHHLMEEIRSLSNIELPDRKLINIFLIGQPELNQVLSREENRALSQRITLRYHLDPLSRGETAAYIEHRLEVAGSSEKNFNDTAIDKVFEYTAGIPRLINILCDHALLSGSVVNSLLLDADIIVQCANELRIPTDQKSISNFRYTSPPSDADADSVSAGEGVMEKEEVKRSGRQGGDNKPESSMMLKWAAGVALVIAFSLVPVLMHMNDKPAEAVSPKMSLNKTGVQDQSPPSGKALDRSSPQPSKPDVIPDGQMNHSRELNRPQKEETPNQLEQIRQITELSPAEIDDVSDNADSSYYNEDK